MLARLSKHFDPSSKRLNCSPLQRKEVVGPSGLEPPTSRLSVVRSSQLSYGPVVRFALRRAPSKLNNVTTQHFTDLGRYNEELASLKSP